MALSLVDLLGETVLVARDPPRGPSHPGGNTHDPALHNLENTTVPDVNTYTEQSGEENSAQNSEVNENRTMRTAEECGGRERRESGDHLEEMDAERYSLVTKDGVVLDIVNVKELVGSDTVIGLYFASSGVPECRQMTELLLGLSSSLGLSCGGGRRHLRVVVVAGDEACYRHHLATTPFTVMPYHYHHVRRALCRRYRVGHLATLVLLDSRTARIISRPSLDTLSSDPEGLKFPWRPRALKELLGSVELVDSDGQKVDYHSFRDGYKALYFSAHWCPPCKAFTPQLIETYRRIRENGHAFEVIFVSSDRSEESYRTYHSSMAWPGAAWRGEAERRELAAALQVEGIPSLVLLGPDDSVLTHQGRAHVTRDPEGQEFPWRDESVELLDERQMCTLLERPCFVIFSDAEGGSSEVEECRELLLPVAEEYLLNRSQHGPPDAATLAFLVAGESELSESLRSLAGLEDEAPLVCILDLAESAKCLMEEVDITTASLHSFLTRYNRQELQPVYITPPADCPPHTKQDAL